MAPLFFRLESTTSAAAIITITTAAIAVKASLLIPVEVEAVEFDGGATVEFGCDIGWLVWTVDDAEIGVTLRNRLFAAYWFSGGSDPSGIPVNLSLLYP